MKADGAFNVRSEQEGLADPNRPVWILENDYPKILEDGASTKDLDSAPTAGAETSSTNTYTFGELPRRRGDPRRLQGDAGRRRHVHRPLRGRGRPRRQGQGGHRPGEPVEGEFVATITDKPSATKVDEDGNVVPAD